MKSKLYGITAFCLSAVLVICIVGVVFSAWIFGSEKFEDLSLRVVITESAADGYWSDMILPSYVVLDEGSTGGIGNTRNGISFYRTGKNHRLDADAPDEVLADVNVSVKFNLSRTSDDNGIPTRIPGLEKTEVEKLVFGFRITLVGDKLNEYLTYTTKYDSEVDNMPSAYPTELSDTNRGNYKDLMAYTSIEDWGKSNLKYVYADESEEIVMAIIFKMTTLDFNAFFRYKNSKRPNGDKMQGLKKYLELRDLSQNLEDSYFLIEFYQGRKITE